MRFLLSFALFLFTGLSWGACQTYSQSTSCGGCTQDVCYIGPTPNGTYVIGAGDYNYQGLVVHWSYEPILNPTCRIANNRLYGTWVSCDTQCEKDSVQCVSAGNEWQYIGSATCGGMSCVEPIPCDTTMNCIEYPFNRCEDVPSSGEVYCDENGCTGLPYSRWFSEYRKECSNECGDHDTQSFTGDTLITFDANCQDSLQCSEETKCVDFPSKQSYLLYKVCIVGNNQIGNGANNRSFPQIVTGGSGSCASLGMPSNNILDPMNNTSPIVFPNTNNYDPITDNCLIYGIDCPENFIDTTDYNDNNNRDPEHCICEKLDGMNHISTIICPDGSRTTFYGSCNEWNNFHSSSSMNPPESSSSGSENPPASSGGGNSSGISGEYPDWPEYQKNQRNTNDVLGSMVQTLKQLPGQLLEGVKGIMNGFVYNEDDSEFIFDRVDSLVTLDTIVDTAGILHAIFNRLDSNNRIIDTIPNSAFNGCPCITFFNGNQQTSFVGGHISFKEIKFNLGDFHGFNLCTIIRTIIVALASVVSFFIGFSIFKNISQ